MDKQPARPSGSFLRSVTGKSKAKNCITNAAGRSTSRPISGYTPRLFPMPSSLAIHTSTSSPDENHIMQPDGDPIASPAHGPSTSPPSSSPINEENEVEEEHEEQEPIGAPTFQRQSMAPRTQPSEKKMLLPKGDDDYVDNEVGTKAITNVFKSRLTQPYNVVTDIPEQELKYCTWDPMYEGHFYVAFKHRLGLRMADIYYNIRNNEKKPGWMLDDVYKALCVIWSRPEFQAVRARNAHNRKSKQGSSVYTGVRLV